MLKDRLSSNLITELLSAAIRKRSVFDILNQYLRFSYLQVEAEKKVWKKMTERYSKTGRVPTIGQLQQAFLDDEGALELIENIRDVDVTDEDVPSLIASLEAYIRQMKFLDANDRIADSYNMGDKEKAYNILIKQPRKYHISPSRTPSTTACSATSTVVSWNGGAPTGITASKSLPALTNWITS